MRKYWLMNRHGSDGPTALVEINGRMKVVDIVKFGPEVAELEAQQSVWDDVIGRVGPTLKPFVEAGSVDEPGIAPHDDLQRTKRRGVTPTRRAGRSNAGITPGDTRNVGGGPSFTRSTGDR